MEGVFTRGGRSRHAGAGAVAVDLAQGIAVLHEAAGDDAGRFAAAAAAHALDRCAHALAVRARPMVTGHAPPPACACVACRVPP